MTKNKKWFSRDPSSGASASVTELYDGSAILKTWIAGKRSSKKYKNVKSAKNAWYRMCA